MKRRMNILVISLVIGVSLISVGYFIFRVFNNSEAYAKPVGELKMIENNQLRSNINKFMEAKRSEYAIGKDNYYCSNILYGYDEKYAYAWVYCSGFVVNDSNGLEQGSAVSAPMRFAYIQPNFQIISVNNPSDGTQYTLTLQKLFPKIVYDLAIKNPSQGQIKELDAEVRSRAKR